MKLSFEQNAIGSKQLVSIQMAPFAFETDLMYAQSRMIKTDKG